MSHTKYKMEYNHTTLECYVDDLKSIHKGFSRMRVEITLSLELK